MIEQMNHVAQVWWNWMSAMFWQVGLLILLIAIIDLLIRKWAWPQLRYALWSLVLIKLVLSPALSLPSGLAPKLKPMVTHMLSSGLLPEEAAAREEPIEFKMPIVIPTADEDDERGTRNDRRETTDDGRDSSIVLSSLVHQSYRRPSSIGIPAVPRLDWRVYTMGAWLLGVVTLGAWLFVKLHRLKKEQTEGSGQPSLPESFYNQLDRCAQRLKLRRKPRVVTTTSIRSPAVFGMFQPVLLMPVGYIRRLSRKNTEYMLLHELAHIKRGDLAAHSFCVLLRLVYWYNPLLWLVGRQLRHLRELCCDATVASSLRDKTVEYRQTLLETARRFLATPVEPGLGLVGLFEDSSRLIARIQWLKKPVWRYRKMKNVAVITAVFILLACVLPMAQANNPQDEDSSVSSEQTAEKSTQSEESSELEQEQQQAQQQLQAIQILKAKLQQLQFEQQKLQKELQALMRAQQAQGDATMASLETKLMKDMAAQASMKAKEAKVKAARIKADVEAKRAKAEAQKVDAEAKKTDAEKQKIDAEVRKAEAEAKKWEQWALKMEAQAKQYDAWANSDAFKKWQKEMEKWAKEQAKAHEKAKEGVASPTPAPHPKPHPMPVMPPTPPMPMDAKEDADVGGVDTSEVPIPVPPAPPTDVPAPPKPLSMPVPTPPVPPVPPTVVAPTPALSAPPRVAAPPSRNLPLLGESAAPAPILPTPAEPRSTTGRDVKISKTKHGKYIATTQMHFVSKVKPGIPFIVKNNLGNITLLPSKDGTCDVRAIIRAKAKTADKAKAMVEEVRMNIDSSKEKYYLKPVKPDGGKWNNLSVDFIITVPLGVKPDIKTDLGNIDLYNLKGHIKALTDLGSLKAVNTTGNLELFTKMGDIAFIAPRDLSAGLEVENKMGSIKSDLPLKVTEIDMFKRKAEGTVGTGQANIRMQTDMGSIRLKWQSSPEEAPIPKPADAAKLEKLF